MSYYAQDDLPGGPDLPQVPLIASAISRSVREKLVGDYGRDEVHDP